MLLIFLFLKSPNCFLASHFHFVDVLMMIKVDVVVEILVLELLCVLV